MRSEPSGQHLPMLTFDTRFGESEFDLEPRPPRQTYRDSGASSTYSLEQDRHKQRDGLQPHRLTAPTASPSMERPDSMAYDPRERWSAHSEHPAQHPWTETRHYNYSSPNLAKEPTEDQIPNLDDLAMDFDRAALGSSTDRGLQGSSADRDRTQTRPRLPNLPPNQSGHHDASLPTAQLVSGQRHSADSSRSSNSSTQRHNLGLAEDDLSPVDEAPPPSYGDTPFPDDQDPAEATLTVPRGDAERAQRDQFRRSDSTASTNSGLPYDHTSWNASDEGTVGGSTLNSTYQPRLADYRSSATPTVAQDEDGEVYDAQHSRRLRTMSSMSAQSLPRPQPRHPHDSYGYSQQQERPYSGQQTPMAGPSRAPYNGQSQNMVKNGSGPGPYSPQPMQQAFMPHQQQNQYYQPSTEQMSMPVFNPAMSHLGPSGQPMHPAMLRSAASASSLRTGLPPPGSGPVRQAPAGYGVMPPPPPAQAPASRRPASQQTLAPVTKQSIDEYRNRIKADPDPEAQFNFAKYLIEAARRIARAGSKDRDDMKNNKKYRDALLAESLKLIKKLATQGTGVSKTAYADAQFFLANCLGNGSLGLQVDMEKAYNLYVQASKQNHPAATYRTAVCNEVGAGTRKDPNRAVLFYRKACALGDTAAMYKLGMILLNGLLGQPRNLRDALAWLRRSAAQADEDNPHALHELGLLYSRIPLKGDTPGLYNELSARECFSQAAQLGYPPSQYKLGSCYEFGALGCPVDPRRSIAWYTRAAERNDPESELALSGWYLTGSDGVLQQSDTEAYLWARRAANKGLPKAEFACAYYHEMGIGVKPDQDEARRWYMRAAAQNNKRAMQRLTELKKLGTQQRAGKQGRTAKPTRQDAEKECVIM
ncbi:uncharacterized protein L969DRAFT_172298 [Mixia osmundae IAM 14324]|uniref:Uncharacterized protein n=1 Tax=Mixia osmundae (strain CBS 9802 / IAM 14324 / JCM 22182 / KY 12970) TaxID=764103 RepID=G7DT25_MIXOS|nr:uncharacterized protein L969DRAFT_172298 [Mixia osmundae IAM 14324]KEI42762.1 hypothetical protein L969DRAFT_172298 [Mixia osmundae IAM 14324]GAA93904.1 hypothetical protein E5Q_00550 [Mixia osmundae IAM 14324]